jgi:hypothetical protein
MEGNESQSSLGIHEKKHNVDHQRISEETLRLEGNHFQGGQEIDGVLKERDKDNFEHDVVAWILPLSPSDKLQKERGQWESIDRI